MKPWYKKWWGIILAVVIFPYFLIWYAWEKSTWKHVTKVIVTVLCALWIVYGFVILLNSTEEVKKAEENNEQIVLEVGKISPAVNPEKTQEQKDLETCKKFVAIIEDRTLSNEEIGYKTLEVLTAIEPGSALYTDARNIIREFEKKDINSDYTEPFNGMAATCSRLALHENAIEK